MDVGGPRDPRHGLASRIVRLRRCDPAGALDASRSEALRLHQATNVLDDAATQAGGIISALQDTDESSVAV